MNPDGSPRKGVPAELKLVTVVYSTSAREPLTALMGLMPTNVYPGGGARGQAQAVAG